jgi:DNA-binding HxlR family transcriptional regulator
MTTDRLRSATTSLCWAVVRHDKLREQPCSIARSVAILGERWTFVILRQAFMGARRFEDYQNGTNIARNILTDRLRQLVEAAILERRPYAEHPGRTLYEYRLTQKGRDLYPILVTLMQWGDRYGGFEHGAPVELVHRTCGKVTQPQLVCSECGERIDPRQMEPRVGPGLRAA